MTASMRSRILFFKEHAGWSTPPGKLECAKQLADAEALGEELELSVIWKHEEEQWETFLDHCDDRYKRDALRKLESGAWECLYAYVEGDGGEILASLGGIIVEAGNAPYKRVVEAELLQEAIASLKSAAG